MFILVPAQVSGDALARVVSRNTGLKLIKLRGCRNLCHLEDTVEGSAHSYGRSKRESFYVEIGATCKLENVEFGWGLSPSSLDGLGTAMRSLRHLTLGLGASLSEDRLMLLPSMCPLLESVVLKFQVAFWYTACFTIIASTVVLMAVMKILRFCLMLYIWTPVYLK